MTSVNRPTLDSLVPLVMIDNASPMDVNETPGTETIKDILRHFESGDLVLVRLDGTCLPAIVFNATGFVMKFDIDRQLYHVCLLDQHFTEQWIDAADMITYVVPMIADSDEEQTVAMWSLANELLKIPNKGENKNRLDKFQKRYKDLKAPQSAPPTVNQSQKGKRRQSSARRTVIPPAISCALTICEEYMIIEAVHRSSYCSFKEAKRIAEETYQKIIYTNNRENVQSATKDLINDSWFITFALRQVEHFRQYATVWLTDLEAMLNSGENNSDLVNLIASMKGSESMTA